MTERKGKRAVIISNIKSESIEQAIFILKTPLSEKPITPAGAGIVAEAQEIINNYVRTIERAHPANQRRHGRALCFAALTAGAFCIAVTIAALILTKF